MRLLPRIPVPRREQDFVTPHHTAHRPRIRQPGQGWIPECVCGPQCLHEATATAPRWVQALRWIVFTAVMLTSPVLLLVQFLPQRLRPIPVQWYAWMAVFAIGVRVTIRRAKDLPTIDGSHTRIRRADKNQKIGELWTSQHTSWLDVILLHALTRSSYVARADILTVPVVRTLARSLKMIPIDRTQLHLLPTLVREAGSRLATGERVIVYPEATTWCGEHRGRFHPAFFEAAASTGSAVRPIGITYGHDPHRPDVTPCFVLKDNGVQSLIRIVRHPGLRAQIWIGPALVGTDRRELAALAERLVFGRTPEYSLRDVQAA